jgi:hypothetical protein
MQSLLSISNIFGLLFWEKCCTGTRLCKICKIFGIITRF